MKILYLGFLGIIVSEYFGLGSHYIPILKKLVAPFSLLMFLLVLYQYKFSEVFKNTQTKLLIFFIFLTAFSMVHGLIKSYALDFFIQQVGYFILFVLAYYSLDDTKKIRIYFTVMVVLHAALAVINRGKYFAEIREGAFKAGYFLADGNDFAWSMVIATGMGCYLFFTEKRLIFKLVYGVLILLIIFAILGTQSRGSALALGVSVFYFWLIVSKRKFIGVFVVLFGLLGVLLFAPGYYLERLGTIGTYSEDSSAMGRIKAWGTALEMAIDNPVLGVGAGSFNSAYGRFYRKFSDPVRWISTHSIYFKTVAEYGFTGLIILLSLIIKTWKDNRRSSALFEERSPNGSISHLLPDTVNMSLIGYSVAGMFLGGINYPHLFLLIAVSLRIKQMASGEVRKTVSEEGGRNITESHYGK